MFQDESVTNLSPLTNMNEIYHWQNKPFVEAAPNRQEHKIYGPTITRKIRKNKRKRTTFTTEQLKVLEKAFASSKYLDGDRRRDLSKVLGLAEKCLKVWFQNKRMKQKREASESSDSSSERYADSMSPKSQPECSGLNTQSTLNHYNTENFINYSYNNTGGIYQNSSEQNQYSDIKLELSHENFDVPSFVHTSCYDNNAYLTQYLSYLKTDNNSNTGPNNGYYENCGTPQTWSSDGFDLSYLQI